jgi:hypothetical protein
MKTALSLFLARLPLAGTVSAQTILEPTVLTLGFEPAPPPHGSRLVSQVISQGFQVVSLTRFGHADDNVSTALPRDGVIVGPGPLDDFQTFRIEAPTDLVTWKTVATNAVVDGGLHSVDPDSMDYQRRFCRAVPLE